MVLPYKAEILFEYQSQPAPKPPRRLLLLIKRSGPAELPKAPATTFRKVLLGTGMLVAIPPIRRALDIQQ